jgi:hypothetical protein
MGGKTERVTTNTMKTPMFKERFFLNIRLDTAQLLLVLEVESPSSSCLCWMGDRTDA